MFQVNEIKKIYEWILHITIITRNKVTSFTNER